MNRMSATVLNTNSIPSRLTPWGPVAESESESESVAVALARVECRTCGELMPVVAATSGSYSGGQRRGMLLGVGAAGLLIVVLRAPFPSAVFSAVTVALGAAIGHLFGRTQAGRRTLTTWRERRRQVRTAAESAFRGWRASGGGGADRAGVLIYVSRFERAVEIVTDEVVASRVWPGQWEAIKVVVRDRMSEGRPTEAMLAAVEGAGRVLTELFPRSGGPVNPRTNKLQVLDGSR